MLYPTFNFNKIIILERSKVLWDTQKNIDDGEKWDQKREELAREIKENKIKKK